MLKIYYRLPWRDLKCNGFHDNLLGVVLGWWGRGKKSRQMNCVVSTCLWENHQPKPDSFMYIFTRLRPILPVNKSVMLDHAHVNQLHPNNPLKERK